ncbi:MAG: tetratricopeptide repeat protein [Bacteroidales bacterium]|nr:tetratricopeptide repeat protein [Bacteroidales bacterium]
MKGLKNGLLFFGIFAVIAACTPAIKNDAKKIAMAEEALFANDKGIADREKAIELVDMYVAYADQYPDDSMAVEYLFKGAEFSLNLGEGHRSIELYDRVMMEYPDFRKVPECMFLKGYVYENYLGELEEAEMIYKLFMEKYPDNEFADDAEISIQNLGKSPEELIKQFEEQQASGNPE